MYLGKVDFSFAQCRQNIEIQCNIPHGLNISYGVIPTYVCLLGFEIFYDAFTLDYKYCIAYSYLILILLLSMHMLLCTIFIDSLHAYILSTIQHTNPYSCLHDVIM